MKTRIIFLAVLLLCLAGAPAFAQFNAFKDPAASGTSSGGVDFKAVNENIQAGKLDVGSTSYVVVLFRNQGGAPIKVGKINLYPSSGVSANVALNQCEESPLTADAQCAITLAITGLQAGTWRVEMVIDHDGRTRISTAAVTGEVNASEDDKKLKTDIETIPEVVDFGTVKGGVDQVRSVILRNRTSEKIKINDIKIEAAPQAGFSVKSACGDVLNAEELCLVMVKWAPTVKGISQGVLMVKNSAKTGLAQVEVKGTLETETVSSAAVYPNAVPEKGLLISDMEEIDFGTAVESPAAITIGLVNTGAFDVELKGLKLAGADNGFSFSRNGCQVGTVLKPSDACPLTLSWYPSRVGAALDSLQVAHTGARGVLILPIKGTATKAVSRDSAAVRKGDGEDGEAKEKPVLDGYMITSHSPMRAVINGPVGSIVVRDGEDVIIAGAKWTVTIMTAGVILTSDEDEVMLLFDRSLKPAVAAAATESSSSTTEETSSSTDSSTTTTQ